MEKTFNPLRNFAHVFSLSSRQYLHIEEIFTFHFKIKKHKQMLLQSVITMNSDFGF